MDDQQELLIHEFACVTPASLEVQLDQKGKVTDRNGTMKKIDHFGMGAMKGFEMSLQALQFKGWDGFKVGDLMSVKLTGMRPPDDPSQSPMAVFAVRVNRPDAVEKAIAAVSQKKDDYQFEKPAPPPTTHAQGPITDDDIPF